MKPIFRIAVIILCISTNAFALTVSNTYTTADIPTNNGSYSATCNGPVTPLTVTLPAGGPWQITSVDVVYDMTAAGGAWMSEQRSLLYCQNTTSGEAGYASGAGGSAGTFSYNRPGLTIANGVFTGGTNLVFEMQAYRTWCSACACSTGENKVDNSTWTVTINYIVAPPMTYTSSTTTQNNTTATNPGAPNQEIVGVEVVTSGGLSPFDLTQLQMNMTGTTNLADVTNIDIYYTGTSSTFATTTLYASAAPAAGTISINGSQTLADGTNYFWIVYDIAAGATVANFVDARCTQITMNGGIGNRTPTVTNPAGNRQILNSIDMASGTNSYTTCNLNFFDDGGSAGIYSNGFSGITTFYPASGGCDKIQLTFNAFTLEGCCDFVRIYDGNSTSAPLLGSYNGTTNPGTFTSTAADGSLTFEFTSDGSVNPAGWDASISCITPASMSFTSSTVAQASTASVSACSGNNEILRVEVVTTGSCNAFDLTQLRIRTNGSTNALGDIANIDVYYTGTSSTFATTTLFASAAPLAPGNNIFVNGTQTLLEGTNYFWVAYDNTGGATPTNVLDGLCSRVIVDGINRFPTVTAPAGSRTITPCIVAPGGVSNNITAWFDANNGAELGGSPATNGGRVDLWTNNAGNASVPTITQTTNARRPFFRTNQINWNPVLEFDGGDDYLSQAATLGSDLFSSTDNTVIMMHRMNSGIVYFKWEQGPTAADRIGFEYSGTKVRFDFPDDAGGNQTVSNSSFSTVGEIVAGCASSNTSTIRINGAIDVTNTTSGTMNTGTSQQFVVGANDLGNPLYCSLDFAELAVYKAGLSGADQNRVESYMAIKYGVTLGTNGTSMDYNSVYGNTVWNATTNAGFCFDIAGISREDNSALDQRKSRTINESGGNPRDILVVANGTNFTTPTAFGSDQGYLVWGHNDGATQGNAGDLPATILTRFNRVWKGQETGTVGTVTLEFDMGAVPGVTVPGTNDLNDVRLLVDADGVFGAGATVITPSFVDNAADIVRFQHNFASGTGFFFTIGSVNLSSAPLPIELLTFDVTCNNNIAEVNWTTASEINNDYFTIERSSNGINFEAIATVNGAGNSNAILDYSWVDHAPLADVAYYRLMQTDFNGESSYSGLLTTACESSDELSIYPNPFNNYIEIVFDEPSKKEYQIEVKNYLGQTVLNKSVPRESTRLRLELDSKLSKGAYFLQLFNDNEIKLTKKIVKL